MRFTVTRVPPNCAFNVDDLETPWIFKAPFDFIHSSNLAQGIRDWPNYIKLIYKYVEKFTLLTDITKAAAFVVYRRRAVMVLGR